MTSGSHKIVPDKGWSWLVLLAAFFCNVTFDGIIYSFGVFYLDLLDHFQEGRARTSWIGSVLSGTYSLVGPLASVLANQFGCRVVTMAGALTAGTGFFLSTFSPNIWVMIVTYGIMGGIGFGLMCLCAYVMIGHFFEKYRALATGVASCGSGVGTFLFAQLAVMWIEAYSWKGAMWLVAAIVLNGIVMGAIFRPIPEVVNTDGSTEKRPLIDWRLFTMPVFIILCVSSFICMIGFFVPFIYLPDYARDLGLTREQGAILLSIIGITNTAGRLLCGIITDKPWADALKIYNGSLILGGTITILCSWLNTFPLLCLYAALFGICVAAYVSLTAIILVEFLGLERLSNSFGFLNMFRGIATFIGAPLAGFLFDVRGDYDLAFYTAGTSILIAGLICVPLRYIHSCSSHYSCGSKVLTEGEGGYHNNQSSNLARQEVYPGNHHLQQKSLYSSTITLAGSHISIVLPNPHAPSPSKVATGPLHRRELCKEQPIGGSKNSINVATLVGTSDSKKLKYSLIKDGSAPVCVSEPNLCHRLTS